MKKSKFLFLFTGLLFSCISKSPQDQAKKMMGSWYTKKIILPANLELLNKPFISQLDLVDLRNLRSTEYYIVHYFDAGCDKCINYLKNAQLYIRSRKGSGSVKYIFIASAPNSYFAKKIVDSLKFSYPVYYEKESNQLHILNKFTIGDDVYNNFLMNKNSELILFGSVFDNKEAEKLIYSIINGEKS